MFFSTRYNSGYQHISSAYCGKKETAFLFPVSHADQDTAFCCFLSHQPVYIPVISRCYCKKCTGQITFLIPALKKDRSFRNSLALQRNDSNLCAKRKQYTGTPQCNFAAADDNCFFPVQIDKQWKTKPF